MESRSSTGSTRTSLCTSSRRRRTRAAWWRFATRCGRRRKCDITRRERGVGATLATHPGDDAAIAVLERKTSFGRGPTPSQLMGVILGPRLRDNARYRALVPKLSPTGCREVEAG